MKRRVIIVPWSKKVCKGARTVAEAAGVPCKGIKALKYLEPADIYINWGYYGVNFVVSGQVVNRTHNTGISANKITTLMMLRNAEIRVPWFTTSTFEAREYMLETGKPLLARTKIRGRQGRGIHLIEDVDQLIRAPLYTEFINKTEEYRVHAWKYSAIDIVRKGEPANSTTIVWSFHNGCRFKHELDLKPSMVGQLAAIGAKSIGVIGLDFGAVDIIRKGKMFYVLEVNTAPGVGIPKTITAYASQIRRLQNEKEKTP